MIQGPASVKNQAHIVVRPFEWSDWEAVWKLVGYHLAEDGIIVDDSVPPPDFELEYDETNPNYPEMDLERIDQAYLTGRGNFWIAWMEDRPLGFVGAQDMVEYIELRRMYVRKEYRRSGIGSLLVRALIEYCRENGADVVKLWTSREGPGRILYERNGFSEVEKQGEELNHKYALNGEIRMCLVL